MLNGAPELLCTPPGRADNRNSPAAEVLADADGLTLTPRGNTVRARAGLANLDASDRCLRQSAASATSSAGFLPARMRFSAVSTWRPNTYSAGL